MTFLMLPMLVGVSYKVPLYAPTANLRTRILDFRGFDSSRILILRGGILMPRGHFQYCLSQQTLVGIVVVGRLGVGPLCKPPQSL